MSSTEELFAILFGTGGSTGLIIIILALTKNLRAIYKAEKLKGATTLEALKIAIENIRVKKNKKK